MKPTVRELRRKKGARLAMLTAYDYPGAGRAGAVLSSADR